MPTIDDAISLAVRVHAGQTDKYDEPYILHVLRVTSRVFDTEAILTALLHDVVEDTPVTLAELRMMGYPEAVVEAVDCLTRREEESYDDMIERIAPNPLAVRVKLADLEDHLDLRHGGPFDAKTIPKLAQYQRAYARLKKGN